MMRILCASLLLAALAACGGSESKRVAPVYPAVADGPYAQRLQACARAGGEQVSCKLGQLPLIGMQTADPQPADLMARLATTHVWMAQRFEQILSQLPPEIFLLARSLTSIIIGSDVRPAFYWSRTGAIYLDPALLWLSKEEKRSIDPSPDFRQGFGSELGFRIISRYVLNNQYAWYGYSLEDDSERSLDDIVAPFVRLLFHELAHAADFLPVDQHGSLDPQLSVEAASVRIEDQGLQVSQRLQASAPLASDMLSDLARVSFFGVPASAYQRALRPSDVAAEFASDQANDDYSYSSRYEDVAMLFEELMMDYSFAIKRDVAVTNRPADGQEHVVYWGQRQRIGDERVRQRAALVAGGLLPDVDFDAYFSALGEPDALPAGQSWNSSLDPAARRKQGQRIPGREAELPAR